MNIIIASQKYFVREKGFYLIEKLSYIFFVVISNLKISYMFLASNTLLTINSFFDEIKFRPNCELQL